MAAAPSPGPRGLAPPWGTEVRRGSRQTQRSASEPAGPTVAAHDAPTSCLGDNGTASLPWALSTATGSAQVRRPASHPSRPLFPASSQPQRPTPRCRQICAGTTSSCSNFPDGSVHFRPFPLEKISPAPGNRIPCIYHGRRPISTRGGASRSRSAPARVSQSPRGGSAHVSVPGGTARSGRTFPPLGLRNRPVPVKGHSTPPAASVAASERLRSRSSRPGPSRAFPAARLSATARRHDRLLYAAVRAPPRPRPCSRPIMPRP